MSHLSSARFKKNTHLLLVANHIPFKDPRIEWQVRHNPSSRNFVCIGLHNNPEEDDFKILNPWENVIEINAYRYGSVKTGLNSDFSKHFGLNSIIYRLSEIQKDTNLNIIHTLGISSNRIDHFKEICRHFYLSALRLVDIGSKISNVSSVIAVDLDSLIAGVLLSKQKGIPLIYDAHEFWPDSLITSRQEVEFWKGLEGELVKYANVRFVASLPTAQYMTELYGVHFDALPNCALSRNVQAPKVFNKSDKPIEFLYQGVISPGRGIELMINAFVRTKGNSTLVIRGPISSSEFENTLRALANNLLDSRIFFAPVVSEAELINAASMSDVGIIPYEPININQIGACPNKLSQYLAACLPIISNNLPFISHILKEGRCGVALDFQNTDELTAVFDFFDSNQKYIKEFGQNGREYFTETFNWEKQSAFFYETIDKIAVSFEDSVEINYQSPQSATIDNYKDAFRNPFIKEIFPLIPIVKSDISDSSTELMDLRNYQNIVLNLSNDEYYAAQLNLPLDIDILFALVIIEAPNGNYSCELNEMNGETTQFTHCFTTKDDFAFIKLTGNLRSSLELKIIPNDKNEPNFSVTNCQMKIYSYGIIKKQVDNKITSSWKKLQLDNQLHEVFPTWLDGEEIYENKSLYFDIRKKDNQTWTVSGNTWQSKIYLPSTIDTVAILIEFEGMLPTSVNLVGVYENTQTCIVQENVSDKFCFMPLSGNLTQYFDIKVEAIETPKIKSIKVLSLGLISRIK